jgi:hypothetical protein
MGSSEEPRLQPKQAFPVKRISQKNSRRNSARRKRKVSKRHARAGHWSSQPSPMFGSGRVHYEIGGRGDVMGYGGIGAVHRLVTRLGLAKELDERLQLLKVHRPYHESDHVLNLAYNVLCGGTRLEDIERLRHDVAYMNALDAELIPDPTTAGDFCRRFSEGDVVALMESINAVRAQLWRGRGRDLLGSVSYIDVDGTLVPTCGKKKAGMDISYKGIWGYAPLIVSLANTKEALYVVNRPGNMPSQHRGGSLDRASHRSRGASCRAGVCTRGHGLLVDEALRQLGREGRLPLRHGRKRGAGLPCRGRGGRVLAAVGTQAPVRDAHRPDAAALPGRREGAHRPGARVRESRVAR